MDCSTHAHSSPCRRSSRRRPRSPEGRHSTSLLQRQLLDIDPLVVKSTKLRLLLESIRTSWSVWGPKPPVKFRRNGSLARCCVQQGDALQEEWPWTDAPELVLTNPPGFESRTDLEGWKTEASCEKNWASAFETHRQRTTSVLHHAWQRQPLPIVHRAKFQILKDVVVFVSSPRQLLATILSPAERTLSTATDGRVPRPSKRPIYCSPA